MPKIIFPVPREEDPVIFTFAPLAILRLAKMAQEAGYEPVILDAKQLKGDFLPRLEKEYKDDPALVWCSGKLGRQLKDLIAAAKLAKKVNPDLPVAFGGWYYPLDKKASLAPDYVDYVVSGQAERTIPELADALRQGGDLKSIKGLRGKNEDGSIWEAPEREWERNLDVFGFYPFDMIDMEFYISGAGGRCQTMVAGTKRSINYTYSRGCHGMCSFCHTTAIWDRGWFSHTPEHVVEELNRLITEYKVEGIDFHDTNMLTGLSRARKILEGIRDSGHKIRWKCSVRVDQVNALSDEMMELIRDTGCAEFATGAESSSSRVLGIVAKEVVATEIVDCSKRCEKIRHPFVVFFHGGFSRRTQLGRQQSHAFLHGYAAQHHAQRPGRIFLLHADSRNAPVQGLRGEVSASARYAGGLPYLLGLRSQHALGGRQAAEAAENGHALLFPLRHSRRLHEAAHARQRAGGYCAENSGTPVRLAGAQPALRLSLRV